MYRAVGASPPAFLEYNQATAYDYSYVWTGDKWALETDVDYGGGWVTSGLYSYSTDVQELRAWPYRDFLRQHPPPYRAIVRYYLAGTAGKTFWAQLGVQTNYERHY